MLNADLLLITTENEYKMNIESGVKPPSHSKIKVKRSSGEERDVMIQHLNSGNSKVLDEESYNNIMIKQKQDDRCKEQRRINSSKYSVIRIA